MKTTSAALADANIPRYKLQVERVRIVRDRKLNWRDRNLSLHTIRRISTAGCIELSCLIDLQRLVLGQQLTFECMRDALWTGKPMCADSVEEVMQADSAEEVTQADSVEEVTRADSAEEVTWADSAEEVTWADSVEEVKRADSVVEYMWDEVMWADTAEKVMQTETVEEADIVK